MRLSVVQPKLIWEDANSNISHLTRLIQPLKGLTDLVILPEMFTTGFTMNHKVSEDPKGSTYDWMVRMARENSFALCGSYPVLENNSYFNRFFFVTPQGQTWTYDKRHLFSMGDEDKYYTKGRNRIVFRYLDFRIIPLICYDLRFPVWCRNNDEYDLAIFVSSWPRSRIFAWNSLLIARSIENQCFTAGSNRIGVDGNNVDHNGNSQIINQRGEIIAHAGDNEGIITAKLNLAELNDFRKRFNFLKDRDTFSIDR